MKNILVLGLADQTAGLNLSLDSAVAENPKKDVLYFYLIGRKGNAVENLSFSELLQKADIPLLKKYLKNHHLSASDEYQMVVTLGMEFEDEHLAEQIICSYIRRYGLSLKAREALNDLGLEQALKTLRSQHVETEEISDLCSGKISLHQRLTDGFEMLRDDEILSI